MNISDRKVTKQQAMLAGTFYREEGALRSQGEGADSRLRARAVLTDGRGEMVGPGSLHLKVVTKVLVPKRIGVFLDMRM